MNLKIQQKETEKEILDLKTTIKEVKTLLGNKNQTELSYIKLNACLEDLNKEIGYSDFILQEINQSIDFNACIK